VKKETKDEIRDWVIAIVSIAILYIIAVIMG